MKTVKYAVLAIFALYLLTFLACESDEHMTSEPPPDLRKPVELRFYPKFGTSPLALNQKFMNAGSDSIWFTTIKFYVSEVALVDTAGAEIPVEQEDVLPGTTPNVWLVDLDSADFAANGYISIMVKANPGLYRGVKFSVGLPFDLNHRDVSTQLPPLGPNSGLYWAWNPGYIFHMMVGKVDSAGTAIDFFYHLGEDNHRLTVTLANLDRMAPTEFVVTETGENVFSVDVDYSQLFMVGLDGVSPMHLSVNPNERWHHVTPANLVSRVFANTSSMFNRTP